MLLGIGKQRIRRLKKAIDAGLTSVPLDGRSAGNGAAARWEFGRDAWLAVDGYLMHIYEYMAEPLAETDQDSESDNSEGEDTKDSMDLGGDESIAPHACVGLGKRLPRKWIGHCRLSQMFDEYTFWHSVHKEGEPASQSTFTRVWKKHWSGVVRIRHSHQHARCAECARLEAMRSKAETEEEKQDILASLAWHRDMIFADRASDARLSTSAEESCKLNSSVPYRVLKIDLDGMDQSKFRCPRNVASTKAHDNLWRPQIHVVGCIIYGVAEVFFATDTDIKKNSDTQQTILSRCLDIASEILRQRGLEVPQHIIFHVPHKNACG